MANRQHDDDTQGDAEPPRSRLSSTLVDPDGVTSASLVVISGRDVGRAFSVGAKLTVGRDPAHGAALDDATISRAHLEVRTSDDGAYEVVDLRSANGTLLNGTSVERAPLEHGDRIGVGRTVTLMFVLHDRYEEQVARMQRLHSLGELAGGIAHDFNNLLGAARECIQSVLQQADVPSRVTDPIKDAHAAVGRCIALTDQLLGYAASRTPARQVVPLTTVVEELRSILRHSLPDSVQLDVVLEPDLFIVGDPTKLCQVLLNLAVNARDAMPEGGALRIVAQPVANGTSTIPKYLAPGDYVRLKVQDSGVGMSASVVQRALEPFFTTKPDGEGTGLGLSTAYSIVRACGGEMLIDSEPGIGSVFTLFLPATAPQAPTAEPGRDRVMSTLSLPGAILVVDDEAVLRRTIERGLKRRGHRVIGAENGVEALQQFREHHRSIAAVVLDLDMPLLGGGRVLQEIVAIAPRTSVIVVSGTVDDTVAAAAMRDGASHFLRKPFTIAALTDVLDSLA